MLKVILRATGARQSTPGLHETTKLPVFNWQHVKPGCCRSSSAWWGGCPWCSDGERCMLDNNKGEHAVRDLGNSEDTGGRRDIPLWHCEYYVFYFWKRLDCAYSVRYARRWELNHIVRLRICKAPEEKLVSWASRAPVIRKKGLRQSRKTTRSTVQSATVGMILVRGAQSRFSVACFDSEICTPCCVTLWQMPLLTPV